jgi:ribosomal-protein-alanine N-acetyltransferase
VTSGGVEFGAARREDLEGVAGLAAATLREAWSETGFAEMLGMPGAVCLVARAPDRTLAGFVFGQRVLDELHVLSLAVEPAWRRRGVACALLEAALGEPPSLHVLLEVRPSNVVARSFYRALGFAEVGRRSGYYPNGEDALLLTRDAGSTGQAAAAGGGGSV